MNPRTVKFTTVVGYFGLPMGISFLSFQDGDGEAVKKVEVSTVCLEGGHLEDPLGICEPEHGYETMVFLDGCSFFSIFTAKYETREAAALGHQSVIENLLAGTLPLAIPIAFYRAHELLEAQ